MANRLVQAREDMPVSVGRGARRGVAARICRLERPMTDQPLTLDDQNLVWIDLEMTGLMPETDRIIEIAVVVPDAQLGRRTEGPVLAIHQSEETLAAMDAWNTGTHGRSGLIDRVRASTVDEAEAERMVIEFLQP